MLTNKRRGEFWQPVTGTVEDGESFEQAALREATEETGFLFRDSPVDLNFEFRFRSSRGAAVEQCYAFLVDGEPTPKLDPVEHQDAQWTEPTEAFTRIKYPSNAEGLRRALRIMFGSPTNSKAK